MTATEYHHVQLDEHGVAWIRDTNAKVVEIVAFRLAYDWHPEQLQRALPHLTLAQIHSALAFYYDHQQQVDDEIKRRLQHVDEFFARHENSALRAKLQAAKRSA
jgi:uncharacterized protein (DUF433 family)